jgi:hypothetical protein
MARVTCRLGAPAGSRGLRGSSVEDYEDGLVRLMGQYGLACQARSGARGARVERS